MPPRAWQHASTAFQRALEIEATNALLVIALAGVVGSVAPPGDDGSVTLTREQITAIVPPKLPATAFVDPGLFVGNTERTRFDLLYSEFMHNWSGIAVMAMGVLWLLQGGQGRLVSISGAIWPWLFVPLAGFISMFADPQVFVLRQVGFWEAISDPLVLEHQAGANWFCGSRGSRAATLDGHPCNALLVRRYPDG